MTPKIRGKRLHIVGSIPQKCELQVAQYGQSIVKNVTKAVLSNAGGLVVTLGAEPFLQGTEIAVIFDWTVLAVVDEISEYPNKKWPSSQGNPVIAVGFEDWARRIPPHRKELWNRLVADNKVELQVVPSEFSVGGIMRQEQSKYGDILLTLGGQLGVYHLSQLYQASNKPVIPINLPFTINEPTASELLAHHANKEPKDFFDYNPVASSITAYSKLSLKNELIDQECFSKYLIDFINHLPLPLAFYVRLLDPKNPDFAAVENFFRSVVDAVILKMGYQRFEMETDFSEDIFMNVELFKKLNHSSLVIVDLTGVRPNCCLELGFALGLGKKFILTAQDGTKIPWDTTSIHFHFWKIDEENKQRKDKFRQFIRKNINKNPLC